jgi:hypothetical protein
MEEEAVDPLQQLAAIREAAEQRQTEFYDDQAHPDATSDGGKIGVSHVSLLLSLGTSCHANERAL